MPGPRAFVETLRDGFCRGESAVISMPEPLPGGLREAVFERAAQERRPRLRLSYPVHGPEPFDWLREILDLDGICDTRALAGHAQFADHVLWVEGVDAVHWPAWRCLLQGFAAGARDVSEHRRSAFCVPLAAADVPLTEDLLLRLHPWSGRVREFDMLCYVAGLLGDDALNPRRHALRLALIAEIAGTDPRLVSVLADCDLPLLLDAGRLCGQLPSLARLGESEVGRRIWFAQVRQLFPLIETHRQAVLARWDDALRHAYASHGHRLTPIADREDDHRALGIGEICYLLCQCGRIGREWREHLQALRSARNRLAHQQPVPEALLERVLAKPL